jgi:hypothetical protein
MRSATSPVSFTLLEAKTLMHFRRFISFAACAVLILHSARISHAQTAASAKSFLTSVFKLYENNDKGTPLSLRYLHSSLLSMIRANLKAANAASEVPAALDADIVCDCQEWQGFWVHSMEVKLEKPDRAIAVVTFEVEAPKNPSTGDFRKMNYTLVTEHGEWRIYDIENMSRTLDSGQSRSLRDQIKKDIADLERDLKK